MIKTLLLLLFVSNLIFAQTLIKGKVTDYKGNPVANATVVITKKLTDDILTYVISDNKGLYSISFSLFQPELDLQVRAMGFATVIESIKNENQIKNFTLIDKPFELKEVVVKTNPITKDGDTIKYDVNTFAKNYDRSIADVIKRMPGIEVLADGKILYQGKSINKFYIEGMDLLEGKYNLANENLPYKAVTQVQILENHQPIKALDSLKFSDNAAINIKLKNNYTFTGQAKLGFGFLPVLWEANVTPMLFTKKRQMLSTYQSNNIGENVGRQLKTLTVDDVLNQIENNSGNYNWVTIQKLASPNFSEKRWLDNNVHLISGNYLQKLKQNYEIRLNVSYLNDYQQQNGVTKTQFITPTKTINLYEEKRNHFFPKILQTNVTLQKNASKSYFKNNLEFQKSWDNQRGLIVLPGNGIAQNLEANNFKIANDLKLIFPFGKQMITLKSYMGFNKTPQNLKVSPGHFEAILNNNQPYKEVNQQIDLRTFFTNNFFSFTKGYKRFSFEPKFGFQLENQNLNSKILTSPSISLNKDFSNNLIFDRSKIYFELQTQYKKDNLRLALTTPINIHFYNINDNLLLKSENLNRSTFEPRLSIIFDFNSFWQLHTAASIDNLFGTINQLHYAYILQNYRNIQRIDTPLPQTNNQNLSIGLSFRNVVKTLFWSISYANNVSENNLLFDTKILFDGSSEITAIEQKNLRLSQDISSRVSKYFGKFKTNISLNYNFGAQEFQQILNTNSTSIKNLNWSFGNKIEINPVDFVTVEYQATWLFSKNKIQNSYNPTVFQQNHLLNLNININENQIFVLKSEYIKNDLFVNQSENLFADLVYRYSIKKKKIDLEIQCNNIFKVNNYSTTSVSDFSYIETNFVLRPRQILFKVRFSL